VVFESIATNLAADTNGPVRDIFWHDRVTDVTQLVSVGETENQGSTHHQNPDVSDNGRYIVFDTLSALNAGDSNLAKDVYRRDRASGTTLLISRDTASGPANSNSYTPSITADGRYVAFASQANDLVANDTNALADVFRRDNLASSTIRLSVDTFFAQANNVSSNPSISEDGNKIAFQSLATNLISGDTNGRDDIFVRSIAVNCQLCISTTTRVSVATDGAQGNSASIDPSVSDDGRFVAFTTFATTLVAGDTNGEIDVLVRDRSTNRTSRVNTTASLAEALNGTSDAPAMSGDGRTVAFASYANNLVDPDANGSQDVFLRAQPVPTVTNATPSSGAAGTSVAVTISGTNFLPGAEVSFQPAGITATVTNVADTAITATFTIPANTPAGAVDVVVANPGTGAGPEFGTAGKCVDCFTVT
jgi:Tol biopolymer transport system component